MRAAQALSSRGASAHTGDVAIRSPVSCHCEPVTDVTGVAIRDPLAIHLPRDGFPRRFAPRNDRPEKHCVKPKGAVIARAALRPVAIRIPHPLSSRAATGGVAIRIPHPPVRNKTVSRAVTLCNLFHPTEPGKTAQNRLFHWSICRKTAKNLTNIPHGAILPLPFQNVTEVTFWYQSVEVSHGSLPTQLRNKENWI